MSMLLIAVYCFVIAVGSFVGGGLPSWLQISHTRMQWMMSAVGGLMLGVALLHLLPHAIHESSVNYAVGAALFGLLAMFGLIRVFQIHHHGPVPEIEAIAPVYQLQPSEARQAGGAQAAADDGGSSDETHDSRKDDPHDSHGHSHDHDHAASGMHQFGWVGLFGGLALHTVMDGVALAASVAAAALHDETGLLLGFGTFLAVLLHKPLEAMSIVSVMKAAGWKPWAVTALNASFALMCPLGVVLFYIGWQGAASQHLVVGLALGFSAGVFLCVALADILPEVQFHSHDRLSLTLALLAGVGVAAVIGFFEPEDAHSPHGQPPPAEHERGTGSHAGHTHD